LEPFYQDYYWKNGRPCGAGVISPDKELVFKIIADPYFKHISVEQYKNGNFALLIYDSKLLDFRQLRQELPPAWEKTQEKGRTIIRDQNDRIAWIETYEFIGEQCRKCIVHSPHGIHLSTHQIYYSALGDPFDGVELFDSAGKMVMRKYYLLTEEGDFGQVSEEIWDMQAIIKV